MLCDEWAFETNQTRRQKIQMAREGKGYWWVPKVPPWGYEACFPTQSGVGPTVCYRADIDVPPPKINIFSLKTAMQEKTDMLSIGGRGEDGHPRGARLRALSTTIG